MDANRIQLTGAAILLAAVVTLAAPDVHAQRRCPASDTGCTMDNAHERFREILRNGGAGHARSWNTYEYNNSAAARRAYRAGQIVRDCFNCGMDAIRDGFGRFSTGSGTSGGVR
jgi:hypothetical protein